MVRFFAGSLLLLCCASLERHLLKGMGTECAHWVGGCMRQDIGGLFLFSIFVLGIGSCRRVCDCADVADL